MRGGTSGSKKEKTERDEECSNGREEKNKVIWKYLKQSHEEKKKMQISLSGLVFAHAFQIRETHFRKFIPECKLV